MKDWYVSCKFATASVTVDKAGVIVDTAPIFKTFIGQSFDNLKKWLEKADGKPPVVKEIKD